MTDWEKLQAMLAELKKETAVARLNRFCHQISGGKDTATNRRTLEE